MNNEYIILGGLFDRRVINVNEANLIPEPNEEKFVSLYTFVEIEPTRTPSKDNYEGVMKLEWLILDIDKPLDEVRNIVNRLVNDFPLWIWFSGRNFHIYIPNRFKQLTPKPNLHIDVQNVVRELWRRYEFVSDNIYDKGRIIRLPLSYNSKTKLYKIPLTLNELNTLTIEQIYELAQRQRDISEVPPPYVNENLIYDFEITNIINETKITQSDMLNIVNCVQRMYLNGPIHGQRHITLLRIASAWRRAGIPKEALLKLLLNWSDLPARETTKIINDVYEKGYSYGCKDSLMSQYCDPNCIYYRHKDYTVEFYSLNDYVQQYIQYIDNTRLLLSLREFLKLNNDYNIYEGEFVMIIGDTGLGKTAFAQNLINYTERKTLYLTFEVHVPLLFRRFVQILYNIDKTTANTMIRNGLQLPSNLLIIDTPLTLDRLYRLIVENNIEITIIDTLDGLKIPSNTLYEFTDIAGRELKSIAITTRSAIIGIHHINKMSQYLGTTLNVHASKGASTLEQKADKVIGISGNRNTNTREISSLKARDESHFQVYLEFDPTTFRFKRGV